MTADTALLESLEIAARIVRRSSSLFPSVGHDEMLSAANFAVFRCMNHDGVERKQYVVGAVRNAIVDRQRWRRRWAREVSLSPFFDRPAPAGADAWMVEDVRAARRRLPWRQRMILVLTYIEGYTLVEAASLLGTSPSTGCILRNEALEALRSFFADEAPAGAGEVPDASKR